MRVIGLDSAETSGIALVERASSGGERLIRHAVVTVRTAADVERVVGEIVADEPDLVAIEEAFCSLRNPSTGLVLAELCGRWRQELERRGLTTVTIPAQLWQVSGMLAGVSHRTRSAERKAAARAFALKHYQVDVGEDAADAICLGTWAARNATRTPAAPGEDLPF